MNLKHEVIGISGISNETCPLLRSNANLVILIGQVLHPFKIEGFETIELGVEEAITVAGSSNGPQALAGARLGPPIKSATLF